jgi:GT2 family glycosyltransferase
MMLVDNFSTDDDVEYMAQNFPEVQILQTGKNGGYSRAYNIAFQRSDAKYFVLLNNDVKVQPDWLDHLVAAAEKDEQIGALQPKIQSMVNEGHFEYAGASGGFMDYLGYPFMRGRLFFDIEKDQGQYDTEAELFWTSGAAMFLRASALKKSGNLDEDFVHHMEEIDLCWRLHLAGYKLKVIPKSMILHYDGGTIKPFSFKKLYWNHRNGLLMLIKNLSTQTLFSTLAKRYILDFINIIYSIVIRFDFQHALAVIKAHIWIGSHLRFIYRKRKAVQQAVLMPPATVEKLLFRKSIILQYFLFGKKTFRDLIKNDSSWKV